MPFNLPIALTWLRVAAIPLLVAIFYFFATILIFIDYFFFLAGFCFFPFLPLEAVLREEKTAASRGMVDTGLGWIGPWLRLSGS